MEDESLEPCLTSGLVRKPPGTMMARCRWLQTKLPVHETIPSQAGAPGVMERHDDAAPPVHRSPNQAPGQPLPVVDVHDVRPEAMKEGEESVFHPG
jgi:hypothetical protein